MPMPSTYLSLEQLRRARSAQRGQAFSDSVDRAQGALVGGLGSIDAARMRAEREAFAKQQDEAFNAARIEAQNALAAKRRAEAQAAQQEAQTAQQQDAAKLAASPRVRLTPDEYNAATGAMMGAVKAGASEPGAQAASNAAWRGIRKDEADAMIRENDSLAKNAHRGAQAETEFAQQDKLAKDAESNRIKAEAYAGEREAKGESYAQKPARAPSRSQAVPGVSSDPSPAVDRESQIEAFMNGKGPAPAPAKKGGRADRAFAEALDAIVSMDERLQDIDVMKNSINTGRAQALLFEVANHLGLASDDTAAFVSATGENFAKYVKSLSGAAASDNEVARLLKNMPTLRDPELVFRAKLAAIRRGLAITYNSRLESEIRRGAPVGDFRPMPVPEIPAILLGGSKSSGAGGQGGGQRPNTIRASDVESSSMLPDGRIEMTLKDGRKVRVKSDALPSFVVGQ